MSDFKLKDILVVMRDSFKDVIPTIYTSERPKVIGENLNEFMVVSLPVMLYNKTYGTGYGITSSYARIEIFVRDVNGVEQVAKLDNYIQRIIDKFPINNDLLIMSRPRVVLSGADGYGFHVATIQASFLTK
jgi:hypothetical protein